MPHVWKMVMIVCVHTSYTYDYNPLCVHAEHFPIIRHLHKNAMGEYETSYMLNSILWMVANMIFVAIAFSSLSLILDFFFLLFSVWVLFLFSLFCIFSSGEEAIDIWLTQQNIRPKPFTLNISRHKTTCIN